MRRVDSLEKTLMLGGIGGRRRRGRPRMRLLDGIMDSMVVSLSELREMVMDREAWHTAIHGVPKSRTWLSNWTEMNWTELNWVLEWIAISFSRGSSWPRYQTRVSHIVDRRFTVWSTREVQLFTRSIFGTFVKLLVSYIGGVCFWVLDFVHWSMGLFLCQ